MEIDIQVSQRAESIQASRQIRKEVFFEEQGIPVELDLDGRDDASYHLLAYVDDHPIGVARLTPFENQKAALSRIAVKREYRGLGIASKVVRSSIAQAEKLKIHVIEMTPHDYLQAFYEGFGFEYIEDAGEVAGHRLVKMELFLS